ncbi:hypothetical protein ABKA04_004970 [Annulohypoxylon sp. FPYF3050]
MDKDNTSKDKLKFGNIKPTELAAEGDKPSGGIASRSETQGQRNEAAMAGASQSNFGGGAGVSFGGPGGPGGSTGGYKGVDKK